MAQNFQSPYKQNSLYSTIADPNQSLYRSSLPPNQMYRNSLPVNQVLSYDGQQSAFQRSVFGSSRQQKTIPTDYINGDVYIPVKSMGPQHDKKQQQSNAPKLCWLFGLLGLLALIAALLIGLGVFGNKGFKPDDQPSYPDQLPYYVDAIPVGMIDISTQSFRPQKTTDFR